MPDMQSRKGSLIYENPLSGPEDLKNFILEGRAALSYPEGALRLENAEDPAAGQKANYVLWCPRVFPSDFLMEIDFRPIREPGLAMIFFAASGRGGLDLFDPRLAPRTGEYVQYHHGDMDAFHLSFFRRKEPDERRFHTCNLRKSYGFHLVAQGADPIPDPVHSVPAEGRPVRTLCGQWAGGAAVRGRRRRLRSPPWRRPHRAAPAGPDDRRICRYESLRDPIKGKTDVNLRSQRRKPMKISFARSAAAGVLICMGCIVNLKVGGGIPGAVLFSAGLWFVVSFGAELFTGRVTQNRYSWAQRGLMLVMNVLGAGVCGLLASCFLPEIREAAAGIVPAHGSRRPPRPLALRSLRCNPVHPVRLRPQHRPGRLRFHCPNHRLVGPSPGRRRQRAGKLSDQVSAFPGVLPEITLKNPLSPSC